MKTTFKAKNPGSIKMELTMSMDLDSWKKLKKQLEGVSHPSRNLKDAIYNMVSLAEKHFYQLPDGSES